MVLGSKSKTKCSARFCSLVFQVMRRAPRIGSLPDVDIGGNDLLSRALSIVSTMESDRWVMAVTVVLQVGTDLSLMKIMAWHQ
mmetsp:Transcript_128/g.330  ORF Transcript_128/g.330 Transcript_128/m.330 type:complete len:83 (-) Transcript_128:981-1229(-)